MFFVSWVFWGVKLPVFGRPDFPGPKLPFDPGSKGRKAASALFSGTLNLHFGSKGHGFGSKGGSCEWPVFRPAKSAGVHTVLQVVPKPRGCSRGKIGRAFAPVIPGHLFAEVERHLLGTPVSRGAGATDPLVSIGDRNGTDMVVECWHLAGCAMPALNSICARELSPPAPAAPGGWCLCESWPVNFWEVSRVAVLRGPKISPKTGFFAFRSAPFDRSRLDTPSLSALKRRGGGGTIGSTR